MKDDLDPQSTWERAQAAKRWRRWTASLAILAYFALNFLLRWFLTGTTTGRNLGFGPLGVQIATGLSPLVIIVGFVLWMKRLSRAESLGWRQVGKVCDGCGYPKCETKECPECGKVYNS